MANTTDAPVLAKKWTFSATVAKVIDNYKLVINRGSENGIREGQTEIKQQYEGAILNQLVKNAERLAVLEQDVVQLKTDVAELKTDVAELKADMAEIKPVVAEIAATMN